MTRQLTLILLGTLCLTAACVSRGGRGGVYRDDPYYDRGVYRDDGALERHQDRERERLEARQRAERERLLREQARERRATKQAGAWDPTDAKDQRHERRRQAERFERQDRGLEREHEDERRRSGY